MKTQEKNNTLPIVLDFGLFNNITKGTVIPIARRITTIIDIIIHVRIHLQ